MSTINEKYPDIADAVDILIRQYGYDGAERRLLTALSHVRQRRAKARGDA